MTSMQRNLVYDGRGSEWVASVVLLGFAIVLALPDDTLKSSAGFAGFIQFGFDDASLAVPIAAIAVLRIAALVVNGNWHRSPMLRLFGAVIGSVLFTMIGVAFWWPAMANGAAFSTGGGTYLVLALFDALSAYRSGADVRMVQQLSARAE